MANDEATNSFSAHIDKAAEHDAVAKALEDAVICVRDSTIPANEAADKIIAVVSGKPSPSDEDTNTESTLNLEDFLWSFWGYVMKIATRENPGLQGRIIDILGELKKHGKVGFEGMKVWGSDVDWAELPIFGAVARESVNGPSSRMPDINGIPPLKTPEAHAILSGATPEDPDDPYNRDYAAARSAWLNTIRYLMRIWASDVYDFEIYGIWFMRDGLEYFDPARPEKVEDAMGLPPALMVEAASICVQEAGEKMYRSKLIEGPNGDPNWDVETRGLPGRGGKRWTGVDGYHPDRWKLWKTVFKEYIDAEGREGIWPNAVEAAKAVITTMDKIEAANARPPN